ncbi:YraN family protein [Alcanivorax sp. JB21]|uniref:YraN family protein n=1 Tax=Alcanivorax limicola TaxID=2874102 RepID=UPI001CBE57D8|nr:YraN family protein [Alcanivorax limicola]MBZ2189650.1 YraN family protein [Alcanivorax limicola]
MERVTQYLNRRQQGSAAERAAERWLQQQGLRTVQRNFHCRQGEIDLIMRTGNTLIFVEVRLRGSGEYGGALASVTPRKQRRLIHAARYYLARYPSCHDMDCRFDVLGMAPDGEGFHFDWVTGAFYAE